MTTETTTFKPTYRKLNALKSDFVRLAALYTENGRNSLALLDGLASEYIDRFMALDPDTDESPAEFPRLLADVLERSAGKFALDFRGTQLWISNGTYGKQETQYKWATYQARQWLKAHGFRWSPNYQAWYYKRPANTAAA